MSDSTCDRVAPTLDHLLLMRKSLKPETRWWMDTAQEILPGLHLGGALIARNKRYLRKHHIKFVVSIMYKNLIPDKTITSYRKRGIEHLCIEKEDVCTEDLLSIFRSTIAVIDEHLQSGRRVLVHCHMGVSRSVTIVIAYIMQRWDVSLHVAYRYVKAKRRPRHKERIGPNAGFRDQLHAWEAQLLKANSAAVRIEAEVPDGEDLDEGLSEGAAPETQTLSKQQNPPEQQNPPKQHNLAEQRHPAEPENSAEQQDPSEQRNSAEQQEPSQQQIPSEQQNSSEQEKESETSQQASDDNCQGNEMLDKYGHVL